MKIRIYIISSLMTCLFLSGCEDPKTVEADLMADCENHYQATSYKAALENCKLAAEAGIGEAQWLLANIYQYDLAEQGADPEKALEWYMAAAENGRPEAQTLIGEAYLNGSGVEKDYDKASEWLQKAAYRRDSEAEFLLGIMYFSGKGHERDTSAAISWFKKAAVKDHIMSINNLAWIHATTIETAFRSAKKAQYWGRKLEGVTNGEAMFLDTRAAVAAINKDFSLAISLQNDAIANLGESVEEVRLLEFQQRLESYEAEQAWQEASPEPENDSEIPESAQEV